MIENGKVTPTIPTLEKLAGVFEVTLVEFFRTDDPHEAVNLPLMEKVKLLDQLGEDEREALLRIIDMAISIKKLKDNLSNIFFLIVKITHLLTMAHRQNNLLLRCYFHLKPYNKNLLFHLNQKHDKECLGRWKMASL